MPLICYIGTFSLYQRGNCQSSNHVGLTLKATFLSQQTIEGGLLDQLQSLKQWCQFMLNELSPVDQCFFRVLHLLIGKVSI